MKCGTDEHVALELDRIMVPGIYRYFEGGMYRMLFTASSVVNASRTKTREEVVIVYVSLETGDIWTRPESDWTTIVKWPDGQSRSRFILVV